MIVNDKVVEYIRRNADIKYSDVMKELESYALKNHVPIIQKEALELLLFMVETVRPARILELGCAIGYSAIAMAKVDEGISIDTLDRDKEAVVIARSNFEKTGLSDRICLHEGEIMDSLESLGSSKGYGLIFIDAGKSHYREYLDGVLPLLDKNGVIFCDNVLFRGNVAEDEITDRKNATIIKRLKKFIEYVTERQDLTSALLPVGDGVMLIRRKER